MSFKRPLKVAAASLVAAAGLSVAGCGSSSPANTDPRHGSVHVDNWTDKKCDGATLVYEYEEGISTVPNSPECR